MIRHGVPFRRYLDAQPAVPPRQVSSAGAGHGQAENQATIIEPPIGPGGPGHPAVHRIATKGEGHGCSYSHSGDLLWTRAFRAVESQPNVLKKGIDYFENRFIRLSIISGALSFRPYARKAAMPTPTPIPTPHAIGTRKV